MDANKLKKLQEIGYVIQPCCGNCDFRTDFGTSTFGTCEKFTYKHEKHTDSKRQLSVNRFGVCTSHEFDPMYLSYENDTWRVFIRE